MATSGALVTNQSKCPFCNSNARREIDLLIYARHFDTAETPATDIVVKETGEVVDLVGGGNDTYGETLDEIKNLLTKLPSHNTKPFELVDLIIHAVNHRIITQTIGAEIRSEGKYLFAGEHVYQTPDLKDYLRLIIAEGARQLVTGEVKVPPKMGIEAAIALWRMSGDTGSNDLIEAIIDITKKPVDKDSPLGKAYTARQVTLAQVESGTEEPSPPIKTADAPV